MNALENEYFEEYKSVEIICNDMYENGVSGYIDAMYENEQYASQIEPNWYKKIKVLKHLRWLRNRIAHGGEDYEVTEQDLTSLKMFHNELLNGKDPLASIRVQSKPEQSAQYDERGWNGWVILLVLVLIIMLVFFTSRMR